jgi:hypothetical protein
MSRPPQLRWQLGITDTLLATAVAARRSTGSSRRDGDIIIGL